MHRLVRHGHRSMRFHRLDTDKPQWDHTFRLNVPTLGPTKVKLTVFAEQDPYHKVLGTGFIDVLQLPWERAAKVECEVCCRAFGSQSAG